MKKGRLIAMLLLALLALLALHGDAQSPPSAPAATPSGAPAAQVKLDSYFNYLWPIITGFVSGVVGFVVALVTLTNKSIQLIKDRGHFWDTRDEGIFKRVLKDMAEDASVLKVFKSNGAFVTEEELEEKVARCERVREEVTRHESTLREHGGQFLIIVAKMDTIEKTINEDKVRKSQEEQAQKMIRAFQEMLKNG